MNRNGFTLIEVLIAGALFIFSFAAFGQLINAAAKLSASSEKLSRALYAARSQMEVLRRQPPAEELAVIRAQVSPIELISLKSRY